MLAGFLEALLHFIQHVLEENQHLQVYYISLAHIEATL